jgi:hypothetical protein
MKNKYVANPIIMCNSAFVRDKRKECRSLKTGNREDTIARRSGARLPKTPHRGTL